MAWAEKLPSGKYRGVYRDAGGKRRSAGTFTHKPRAERAAAAAEERARRALAANGEGFKIPWGQWCDDWWPTRNVEPSTLKVDAYRRAKHLDPRWSAVPLGAIRRHDVEAWAATLRRDGLGPASVRRVVRLLSVSLEAAVDAQHIEANPASRIKLSTEPPAPERFLTREEYAAIRAHLPTTDDQFVADLLVYTGMRWGEMSGLHWHRVDLARGFLQVVETYDDSTSRIKAYPKGKAARPIPLTPELVKGLRERQGRMRAAGGCGVEHTNGKCRSGLVVTTPGGRPLRNSNWTPTWRMAVDMSGVGHVRPHDLRHTFASWLLQAGIPLAEVSRLLGHSSLRTTERYAHLAEPPNEAVLAALAAPRLPPTEAIR